MEDEGRKVGPWVATAIVAALAVFVAFGRLGVASWQMDELVYRDSGLAYLRGDFREAHGHPPLGQWLYGIAAWLGGPEASVVRLPAALATLTTGVVLFAFAREVAGPWAGVATLAVFALMPCTAMMAGGSVLPLRVDRFALLDPVLGGLVALGSWLGWRWRARGGSARAAAAGFAIGLASMTKVVGIAVAPVIVLFVLWHRRRPALRESVAFAAAGCAAVIAVYAPFGAMAPVAINDMLAFQTWHRATGHPAIVAETFHLHPPWWALFRWQWDAEGSVPMLATFGAVLMSSVTVASAVRWYLLALIGALIGFLTGVANIALPHYVDDWWPPLALLTGITVVESMRRGGVWRGLALGLAGMVAVASSRTIAGVSALVRSDYSALASGLTAAQLDRAQIVVLGYHTVLREYLPHATVIDGAAELPPALDLVVVDPVWASRFEMAIAANALRALLPDVALCRFDRLFVYVRQVPSTADWSARCTRPAQLPPRIPGSPTLLFDPDA